MNISPLSAWLYDFTAELPCRLITRDGEPYLERYYLSDENYLKFKAHHGVPLVALALVVENEKYLHRFVGSGADAALHDHPWAAFSQLLTGRYTERVAHENRPSNIEHITRRAGDSYHLAPHYIHQIIDPLPETWTLFITDERVKSWSFFIEQDWRDAQTLMMVNWRDYLEKRGETQAQQVRHDWWNDPDCTKGSNADRQPFQHWR